jgi:tetratricopeptide (TPR) repeat protein
VWIFLLSVNGFSDEHDIRTGVIFFLPERIIDSYFPWGKMYLIPDDPDFAASIKRAEEFERKNDFRQASRYYFLAYRKAENTPKAPYILFKQSTILEDTDQSIKGLTEILEVYPGFPLIDAVRFELAKNYFIQKKYANASRLLEDIENNEKDTYPIFTPYVYTFLGAISYKVKDYEKAASYYVQANEMLASGDPAADRISILNNYFELSRALTQSNDLENAETLLIRLLGSVQSDILKQEALLQLGFLYKKKGDIDGAYAAFNSIVQGYPGTLFALKAEKSIEEELGVRNKDAGLAPMDGIFDMAVLGGTYTVGEKEETQDEEEEEVPEGGQSVLEGFAVQLGSFSDEKNADKLVSVLIEKGFEAYSKSASIEGEVVIRVRVGTVSSREDAEELNKALNNIGYQGFIVEEK